MEAIALGEKYNYSSKCIIIAWRKIHTKYAFIDYILISQNDDAKP